MSDDSENKKNVYFVRKKHLKKLFLLRQKLWKNV